MNSTTTASTSFSQMPPMVDTAPSSDLVSLRNFVVDEDRANLGSDLWKSLDKSAFILAQRDAIETFNLARAMRLSEESAANDERRRLAQAEEAARSLARSWNVDGLQTALLKNTSPPSSSSPPRPRHLPPSSPPSRPTLKRNPSTTENPSNTPQKVSSASAASAESSSQQKRRKASISSSSQPQYSYSTSNYSSYPYQSHNQSNTPGPTTTAMGTSQASVHAQQHSEGRRHSPSASSSSSASSRDIQAGQILNPKESSPRTQSPLSSASAQAAAAEREKEREKGKGKEKERSRSNSNSNSSSTSRKRSSSSAAQQVNGPQPHPQVQVPPQNQSPPQPQAQTQQQQQHGPRDIFSPVRFNCTKCGNSMSSVVHSDPSLALTSPDPFAHPFASALHVICANPSCGAVHCRGCLQTVKCRDVDHPSSDSQALVLVSSTSTSPPASNPTSPTRLAFSSSKSHQQTQSQAHSQRACAGGPGCALWSCCSAVRVIAVWEALRAFDALFSAEAGFQVSNQQQWRAGQAQAHTQGQGETVGRQCREAYIRTVISSKADKSMRKFEDGFVRVLKVVASWLQFPAELSSSAQRQSMILEPDDESQSPDTLVLLHLARLFSSSYLLEVVHTFLSNRNVKDWMTHAETYLDLLDVVGKMMDCGLGFLLKEVSGVQVTSTPALASAPGPGYYNPFAAVPTSLPSSVSPSPSQSPPPFAPLTLPSVSPSSPPPTLYDLVSQLESYRGELKKFLTKVSFGVTVDKASKLHEAITYLVLQLVVGEF